MVAQHPKGDPIRLEDLLALDLDPALRRRAVALVAEGPDRATWRRLLGNLTLGSGTSLVLAGVICFFAFNWQGLHRFAKFGLVGAGLCATAGFAWKTGLDRLAGKAALAAACVLVGVWLAVFGQVYQTGADPFELFRGWALLILPWVILARFEGLWAFWILLLNAWLGLWLEQGDFGRGETLCWSLAALNGAAWLVREALQDRLPWTGGRWLPRLLVLPALGGPAALAADWIIEGHGSGPEGWAVGVTLALAGGLLTACRRWRRDLFMVTAALGACMTLATTALGKELLDHNRGLDGCSSLLFLGLALVAQVGGAAAWLRSLLREAK